MIRKQKSGHAKAIIRQRKDDVERSQAGDMFKYLAPTIIQNTRDNESESSDEDGANNIDSDEEYENLVNTMLQEDDLLNDREDDENVQEEASEQEQELDDGENEIVQDVVQNEEYGPENIHDPGNWNKIKINQYLRDCLVENGPVRRNNTDFVFPKDVEKRSFDADHYTRYLSNGETEDRRWLVYSNVSDRVFCFCCKLFKQGGRNMQLDTNGSKDWHNMSAKLSRHETSAGHLNAMSRWKELEIRLRKNETIDKEIHEQIKREKEYWKQVLIRIVAVIRTLAKNNLAFRGVNDKVGVANNGNFLSFVEMIAEFDLVMQEHLRRIKDHEVYHHYLGPLIQNELIVLLARHVKDKIVQKIQEAKYFSVILDCTPDISNEEQMSLIIRCVDVSKSPTKVEEYFLGFVKVEDSTGRGLFNKLEELLQNLKLDIRNVRGQGYDNGANMTGKNKGVQKRLLKVNPRAFHMPCACHSLNLALCNMASSCPRAVSFFQVVQRIYNFFSASTKRWTVFKKHVTGLTVKPLSDTRWESHIEAIKAIRFQAPEIRDALQELSTSAEFDAKTRGTTYSILTREIDNFELILGMVVWHRALLAVNSVSIKLQTEDMNLDDAVTKLKDHVSFFKEYRKDGFEEALEEAKTLAASLNIDPVFYEVRVRKRKKHHDEIDEIEEVQPPLQGMDAFRVEYFNYIMDQAISSLKRRFKQFQAYEETFGFLFHIEKLRSLDDNTLRDSCVKLEKYLSYEMELDINGNELYTELKVLRSFLPKEAGKAIEVLNF